MTQDHKNLGTLDLPYTNKNDAKSTEIKLTRGQLVKAHIQLMALCCGMYLFGWNDGSRGPLLPTIQNFYHLNYILISLIFVTTVAGFLSGSMLNLPLTDRLGFGKMIAAGIACSIIAYALEIPAPPYPAFLISFTLHGLAFGILSTQMTGYVASLKKNSSLKMCILHASYGAGALCSPFVATKFSLMRHWSFHYLTTLSLALINAIILLVVFKLRSQNECLEEIGQDPIDKDENPESKFSQIVRIKAVYLMTAFLFVYLGVETAMGGWIVTFIINVRHGGPSSGYISSGFFGGLTLGRAILVPVNQKIGTRRVIFLYGVLAIAMQLVTWFVPSLVGDAVAVSFIGFVLGPIYPLLMAHGGKILPPRLIVPCLGFISGISYTGTAVLPFAEGAMAEHWGIQSLQPFLAIMVTIMMILWYFIPTDRRGSLNGTLMERDTGSTV